MNNNNFSAQYWFQDQAQSAKDDKRASGQPKILPPFQRRLTHSHAHNLQSYLSPGWNGQSLGTKKYFKALHHLEKLQSDLLTTFSKQKFPPKHLNIIYSEYVYYQKTNADLLKLNINSAQDLSNCLLHPEVENNELIQPFLKYYSARLIMLYFLQLRLLKTIQPKLNMQAEMRDLLSPPLALAKIFIKGTSKEIQASSLETNQYSWYRPAQVRLPQVSMLYHLSAELSYSETLKLLYSMQQQVQKGTSHSHALSHLGTGLFVNCLQVNFPSWSQTQQPIDQVQHVDLAIKSSLYTGDYLEELAVSHWLAQDNNKTFVWDQILCPQFIKADTDQHYFDRYYNELQFLQLLSEVHPFYKMPVVEFIAQTFKQWVANMQQTNRPQTELFEKTPWDKKCQYDQIILSVLNLTKQNPHNLLTQKINHQLDLLKESGQLIVLSKQNLFLPSQRERVDQLLKKLEPMAIFSFDQLSGRGEIPDFIYIFKKRDSAESVAVASQACSTFHFHGDLTSFQNFCQVPEELNSFFQKFMGSMPTFYQSSGDRPLKFEFFQDAIVNGVLLHSNNQQSQNVTHPAFLRKLLSNALPLNYYFDITYVDGKILTQSISEDWSVSQQLPLAAPISLEKITLGDLALILDLRDNTAPRIELTTKKLLKSKAFEYGISECHYYYLSPKLKHINLPFLIEYVRSTLGRQICAISLLGHKHQVRSKLHTLLVPNLLVQKPSCSEKVMPFTHLAQKNWTEAHEILNSISSLNDFDSSELVALINALSPYLDYVHGYLYNIDWEKNNLKEFNFNTPALRQALMTMPLRSIYPNNPEVQIDFLAADSVLHHAPLSKHELHLESLSGKIVLYSANTAAFSIKASPALLVFIHFLLKKLPPQSLLELLTKLKTPSEMDCSALIRLKEHEASLLVEIKNSCTRLVAKILQQGIVK